MVTTRGTAVRALAVFALTVGFILSAVATTELYHLHFDRRSLPDLGPFTRFELPTIGRIYDADGRPLIELAREFREITPYEEMPPVVRAAILAAEDKRFFTHNGIDYSSLLRVVGKVRVGILAERLASGSGYDEANGATLFPQGGSSITQQLVRGSFLRQVTVRENSYELRPTSVVARLLAAVMGPRSVNMLARKREEARLSLWLEREMRQQFGSKRRAKEEILARYATFVYMGNGQYGFRRAAEYYFGRRLSTFSSADADKAALLAGIAKAPRDYAPNSRDPGLVLSRRNQTLMHMQANGFLSPMMAAQATARVLQIVRRDGPRPLLPATAVVAHVLEELKATRSDLGLEDLLQGRIRVYATADTRVQEIVSDALEMGLARYEQRHPQARGVIQGAVVVLHNSDGRILAETGGRRVFNGLSASYTDYNRVTRSLRQPGSAMKPLVYLAAFRRGGFTLETLVPDEPISVRDGGRNWKWISNYDGRFKGLIPVRQALAESRNAVAVWMAGQIGIDSVLGTSRSLGVRTPLGRYPTTALGASEVNLLELANVYRAMASGIVAEPYVIKTVVRDSGEVVPSTLSRTPPTPIDTAALSLIQEGLRGVVRLPTGTAHALASHRFPIAVMGKTGTTNEFRDAIFVGSTYGPTGITVAVRVGFDDNRSLGRGETGGRVALPVFQAVMLGVYDKAIVGPAPVFPARMEARITASLRAIAPPAIEAPGYAVTSTIALESGQR